MNIEIKSFDEQDFSPLFPLLTLSTGVRELEKLEYLVGIEKARGTKYYTALSNNQIIGLIGVYYDESSLESPLEPAQIIDFAVLKEHWGNKIGRKLMEFVIDEIKIIGCKELWLFTDGNSQIIQDIYGRFGFEKVSEIKDWYGKGSSRAVMKLEIVEFL